VRFIVDSPLFKIESLKCSVDCLVNSKYEVTLIGERYEGITSFKSIVKLGQTQKQIRLIERFECQRDLDNTYYILSNNNGILEFRIPYLNEVNDSLEP